MSLTRTVYCGPWVRCPVSRVGGTTRVRTCPELTCKRHGQHVGTAYCPDCGEFIADLDIPCEQDSVSSQEITERLRHALVIAQGDTARGIMQQLGIHAWLPNQSRGDFEPLYVDPRSEAGIYYFDAPEIQVMMQSFLAAFAPEIALLREAYGTAEVVWGLLVYSY